MGIALKNSKLNSDSSSKGQQIKGIYVATGFWVENEAIFLETPSLSHKTPVLLLPDHYEAAWEDERKIGKNATFHANKEAKHSNKSSRFVNLYEFHLKCYGIKLNPMHGCSRRSCRDISVQLMMVQTLSDRSWKTLSSCLPSLNLYHKKNKNVTNLKHAQF